MSSIIDKDETTRILIGITELASSNKALHKRFDKHEEDTAAMLGKHNETLYGNGRPGLTSDVAQICIDVHEMKKRSEAIRTWLIKLITPVASLALMAVLYLTFGGSI